MVFLGWLLLVAASLGLSFGAFFWALRSGQFADQGRARFLALEQEAAAPPPGGGGFERYALLAVALWVGLGLCAPLVLSLVRFLRR